MLLCKAMYFLIFLLGFMLWAIITQPLNCSQNVFKRIYL